MPRPQLKAIRHPSVCGPSGYGRAVYRAPTPTYNGETEDESWSLDGASTGSRPLFRLEDLERGFGTERGRWLEILEGTDEERNEKVCLSMEG